MGGDTLRGRVAQLAARLHDGVRALLRAGRSRSPSVEVSQLSVVLITAAVVTAGTVAVVGVGTQSAMAVSATASDINVSSNDGNLTAVTIEPELTISWSNVDSGVEEITTQVDVSSGGETRDWHRVNVFPWNCDTRNNFDCGETSYTVTQPFQTMSIADTDTYQFDRSPFSLSDFNASDGQTTQTDVVVRFQLRLYGSDGNVLEETQLTESFTVTVENREGEVSASATLNTNAATPT